MVSVCRFVLEHRITTEYVYTVRMYVQKHRYPASAVIGSGDKMVLGTELPAIGRIIARSLVSKSHRLNEESA